MKKIISICSIVFGIILSSLTYLGIDKYIGINKTNPNVSSSSVETEVIYTNNYGHEFVEKVEKNYYGYDTEILTDDLIGITGYKTDENVVSFDNISSSRIYEQIYSNGKDFASKYFYNSDMNVDTLLLGDTLLDYAYDDNNNLYSIVVNDTIFSCEYDEYGRVIKTYVDDNVEHEYQYNDLGYITKEIDYKGILTSYSYDDNYLEGDSNVDISLFDNRVKYTKAGKVFEYIFDYTYDGVKYCTSIIEDGLVRCKLTYLNNKVTSVDVDGFVINYVLDSSLNYVGLTINTQTYYFINDFFGNVYAIIDDLGNPVVYYNQTAYGDFEVSGKMASNLGAWNVILDSKYIVDPIANVRLGQGEIILSNERRKVALDDSRYYLTFEDSLYYKYIDLFRDEMGVHAAIKGKVMENVLDNFNYEGMEIALSVPLLNNEKEYVDTVDVYVIDYMYTDYSFNNLINGSQIYNVVYRDVSKSIIDEEANYIREIVAEGYKLDYYQEVTPSIGRLVFEGQFIYLNKLVKYNCDGDGVIYYYFENNEKNNYSPYTNLYDYDDSKYVNYVNNTFDIDLWDYVEIIPGMNQEVYKKLDGYIDDALKVSTEIVQEDFTYFDESYFQALVESENGDTLAAFDHISENDMVVMSSDGDFIIKAIPWNESREFIKSTIIAGVTVVSLTIVTVIAVVAPFGQVLIPIVNAAWSTAITSICLSLVIPVVTLYADTMDGNVELNLNDFLRETMTDFFNSFTTGAIAGAIFGGLTLFKNNLLNKSINRSIEKLDDVYTNFLLTDSSAAYNEHVNIVASIRTGKSTVLHRYLGSNIDVKVVKWFTKSQMKKSLAR